MSQLPMILELGVGSALRSGSYTKAACRAVRDALWCNSINLVEVFGAEKSNMQIKAEIACQNPNAIDLTAVEAEFPYGNVTATAVQGGLDIPNPNKPDQPSAIIAHAAIIVSLDVTKKGACSMKRLILEMGSGADLYGMDYTKAALRAFNDAIRHSSIILFRSLDLDHSVMNVKVTIGVQDPEQVDVDRLMAEVPRGNPQINVVFGGHNITTTAGENSTVVATCAIEAFVPDLSQDWSVA